MPHTEYLQLYYLLLSHLSQIYCLMIHNVQYLLHDFKTSLSKKELQNDLKLMQKTCTNAEELSTSLYSGKKCTL